MGRFVAIKGNMRRRLKRNTQTIFLVLISLFLSLEFFSFLFFYFNFGASVFVPDYWAKNKRQLDTTEAYYTEYHEWGTWHNNASKARDISACFNVEYIANSYGARDIERSIQGKNRVVFLGDSFVEGWGVSAEERMTNILEEFFGVEFLNFGVARAGPISYELIYKNLAGKFEHDHVIVGFFPNNDFRDNDLDFQRLISDVNGRFRPYYSEDGEGILYKIKKPEEGRKLPITKNWMMETGRKYFWFYGVLREIRGLLIINKLKESFFTSNYSGYRDALDSQIHNTLGSLRRIAEEAKRNNKSMTVVLFPMPSDYEAKNRGDLKIQKIFKNFAEKTEINYVDLIDLIDYSEDLYHSCDPHWSSYGNLMAANALIESLPKIITIRKH